MRLSEHIARCVALLAEHGDLPVFHREVDPYTGADWEEEPDVEVRDEFRERRWDGTEEVHPKRALIRR